MGREIEIKIPLTQSEYDTLFAKKHGKNLQYNENGAIIRKGNVLQ